MKKAIEAAVRVAWKKRDHRAHHIGCALVRNDGVIIAFSNKPGLDKDPRGHAEARCARKATPDSIAYVVRVLSDGSFRMARPCRSCQLVLRSRGVSIVHYTNWQGRWESMNLLSANSVNVPA